MVINVVTMVTALIITTLIIAVIKTLLDYFVPICKMYDQLGST